MAQVPKFNILLIFHRLSHLLTAHLKEMMQTLVPSITVTSNTE